MTAIPQVTGVLIRKKGEPKPAKYRRRPEPQGPFEIEAADAERAFALERKAIGLTARRRRHGRRRGRRL